jgi:hypothetical protein
MTLIPVPDRITSPRGGETSLSVSREKFIFEVFGFQERDGEKLALGHVGC